MSSGYMPTEMNAYVKRSEAEGRRSGEPPTQNTRSLFRYPAHPLRPPHAATNVRGRAKPQRTQGKDAGRSAASGHLALQTWWCLPGQGRNRSERTRPYRPCWLR
jgi:hypothetical protein